MELSANAATSSPRRKRWWLLLPALLLASSVLALVAAIWWDTGTHIAPLHPSDPIQRELVDMLPPRGTMWGEGLRFVAVSQLARRRPRYAIALSLPNAHDKYARGVAIFKREGQAPRMQAFYMPSAAYYKLVAVVDARMDWNMGDYDLCYDGVDTSFERKRGPLFTSGQGNCDTARGEAASYILQAVRPYAATVLPATDGWNGSIAAQ